VEIFLILERMAPIALPVIGGLATLRWWWLERRNFKERPAVRALDGFFSAELSKVRYRLFDHIMLASRAAAESDNGDLDIYRRVFGVNEQSPKLKSRYELFQRWGYYEEKDEGEKKIIRDFLLLSGLMQVSIQAIFNAAEHSPESAKYIQKNMGRLLVWWMLVWPGAFDHTGKFLGEKFVKDVDVGQYNPRDAKFDAYTKLFRKHPLWSHNDWQGAKENYESLKLSDGS